MTRIGEIILIQPEYVTIECYSLATVTTGMLVRTETHTHWGMLSDITSVCIEDGNASQAFGDSQSNDKKVQSDFPHLKNSLRTLAKLYTWELGNDRLSINQGIYSDDFAPTTLDTPKYWRTLGLLPLNTLRKHISWLTSVDPLFSLEAYVEKLSKYSRPLAWNIYLQDIET